MLPTTAPRFAGYLRLVGLVLLLPSLGAIGFASSDALSRAREWLAADAATRASWYGSPYGNALSDLLDLFIGGGGLFLGLIGTSFLRRRRVFHCCECDYVLDRA
jgi:hypothetical protein